MVPLAAAWGTKHIPLVRFVLRSGTLDVKPFEYLFKVVLVLRSVKNKCFVHFYGLCPTVSSKATFLMSGLLSPMAMMYSMNCCLNTRQLISTFPGKLRLCGGLMLSMSLFTMQLSSVSLLVPFWSSTLKEMCVGTMTSWKFIVAPVYWSPCNLPLHASFLVSTNPDLSIVAVGYYCPLLVTKEYHSYHNN